LRKDHVSGRNESNFISDYHAMSLHIFVGHGHIGLPILSEIIHNHYSSGEKYSSTVHHIKSNQVSFRNIKSISVFQFMSLLIPTGVTLAPIWHQPYRRSHRSQVDHTKLRKSIPSRVSKFTYKSMIAFVGIWRFVVDKYLLTYRRQ
jgi:hypothetical protein